MKRTRLFVVGVALALFASGTSLATAAFDDVVAGSFYEAAVEWFDEEAITTGTSPTTFSPNRELSRAEAATFIWRFGHEPVGSSNPFVDVPEGVYYTAPVKWMADSGITTGTTATTFSPDGIVTRGQVATFLWRFMCEPAATANPFVDVPDGAFYTEAVKWMAETGITTGTSPTTFSPDRTITRAEIATFMWRLAGEPAVADGGDNRVSLAPTCDGTPPPPPPGVGALSISPGSAALGDLEVLSETDTVITLTNTTGAGGPAISVTALEFDTTEASTATGVFALDPGESRDITITVSPETLGAMSPTLTVRHNGSNGLASAVPLSWTGVPGIVQKINAGGAAVGDWTADPLGAPVAVHNMSGSSDRVFSTADPIAGNGSVPSAVYQTARRDISSSLEMMWDVPVPAAGSYLVRLHFAEIDTGLDQQRVRINDEIVLDSFDVGDEAGGTDTALVRSFFVTATDSISIDFHHIANLNATFVSGIEVLALGTNPPGYLQASPSVADLGSVSTAFGSTSTTVTITNFGSTAVTIPTIAAADDFTPDKGSLVVPAGGSAEIEVTFDPSSDGIHSAWLSLAHSEDPSFGIHLWGHGGLAGRATFNVHKEKTNNEVSVFQPGSMALINDSATTNIASLVVDLSGSILDDLLFDVEDSVPVSGSELSFRKDFGDGSVSSSSASDAASNTAAFTGLTPGRTILASIDIDPESSEGMVDADHTRVGPVSGLEMVGATVTVTFAGGATASGPLWTDGSVAGATVSLWPGAPAAAPTISLLSGVLDGATTVTAAQSVEVVCVTGQTVDLIQVEAELDMTGAGGGAPTPVGGHRVLSTVLVDTATCAGSAASFAVTLQDTTAADGTDGWNHFMVRQGDPTTGPTSVSDRFSVRYTS